MLQRIMMNTVCGRLILSITVAGLVLRMITVLSYKGMKHAAENVGKTKKQWIMILKKRFENYGRFGRIGDVRAFVEHYFAKKKILGLPMGFWDRSPIVFALASFLTGLTGAFFSSLGRLPAENSEIYVFSGLISGVLLLMSYYLYDTKEAKIRIRAALTDYFANGTMQRGTKTQQDISKEIPTKEEVDAMAEAAVTEAEKEVLKEVLTEYFW